MAGAKFEYDESGGASFYFILSFLALILVPCTYFFWPFTKDEKEAEEKTNDCLCVPCMKKRSRMKTERQKNSKTLSTALLVLGWIAFAFLAYKVSTLEREVTIFDPYEVLGLDKGATVSEIRRAYRKLSLQFHPDKPTGDHAKFMKIAKSYQALTDEESRKNWEEFGSPDGPQAAVFGIALPSWIVDKDNSIWVLGAYLIAFVVVLPMCVGTWWYRSIKYTSDEILVDTTRLYYHFLMHASLFPIKRAMMILSGSMEFEPSMNKCVAIRPSDNSELPELMRKLPDVVVDGKRMPFNMPYSVKARLLLGAHLDRLELPANTLEVDKEKIVGICPRLVQEMISCMSQIIGYLHQMPQKGHRGPSLDAIENNMRLSAIIVQAVKDHHYALLQLPHFTDESLRHMRTKKRAIRSLCQLAELPEKDRRQMLRHFDGQEYSDIITVLAAMPYVTLECIAEVRDDENPEKITAGSLITVTTMLRRKTIGDRYNLLSTEQLVAAYDSQDQDQAVGDIPSLAASAYPDADHGAEGEEGDDDEKAKSVQWMMKKKDKKPVKKSKQQSKGDRRKKVKELAQQKQKEEEEEQQALARRAEEGEDDEHGSDDEDEEEREEDGSGRGESPSPRAASGPRQRRGKRQQESESEEDGDDTKHNDEDDEEEWQLMQKERGDDFRLDAQKKTSPVVHAPYFPETKHEKWWLYICDRRKKELISVPQQISSLRDLEELKTPVPAPQRLGPIHYSVVLRSDSYIDVEYTHELKFEVHAAPEMKSDHAQWKDLEAEDEESDGLLEMSSDEDGYTDEDD